MPTTARESYVETGILTATPQKLQLMLIEGAIRFAERAKRHWEQKKDEDACEDLIRAQEIVTEILAGLKPDARPALVRKCASIYLFVFRQLMEANLHHDRQKVDAALRVLEVERETWTLVCQKLGETDQPPGTQAPPVPADDHAPQAGEVPPAGLSLDA